MCRRLPSVPVASPSVGVVGGGQTPYEKGEADKYLFGSPAGLPSPEPFGSVGDRASEKRYPAVQPLNKRVLGKKDPSLSRSELSRSLSRTGGVPDMDRVSDIVGKEVYEIKSESD